MKKNQNLVNWRTILAIIASLIVLTSLFYTNFLARKIEKVERQKVRIYADTLQKINEAQEGEDVNFYFDILNQEKTIPIMEVNQTGEILSYNNLNEKKVEDLRWLERQKRLMKKAYAPIEIDLPDGEKHFYYYRGSRLLNQLKWFPFFQFGTIVLFLASAYYLFNQARKSEQNQVWVGMSKETAHQLGTPISSMMAWIELLKSSNDPEVQSIIPDMAKDINRLDLISDRFSKIGSKPQLTIHSVQDVLTNIFKYMERRSSKHITFELNLSDEPMNAMLYPALFDWVIENLVKNALDAIVGDGTIAVTLKKEGKKAVILVKDSGKGIGLRNKNMVFKPGYSTKKRGWGLGLSLSKRIIEDYHKGKLFVAQSEKNVGTTFRIEIDLIN